MKKAHIIIPELPPTDNHTYGQRGKTRFMYKEAKEWKELAGYCAKQSWRWGVSDKKFRGEVWFYLKRDRDVHGSMKLLFDAFEGIVYENDKQVFNQECFKVKDDESKENPRVEIYLTEMFGDYLNFKKLKPVWSKK